MSSALELEGFTAQQELQNGFYGRSTLLVENCTGKMFLCKSCKKDFIGQEKVGSFISELKEIQSLDLPFLIGYTQIIETREAVLLIRPYLECPNLAEYLEANTSLSSETILSIWVAILKSVTFFHHKGIGPLPIKPTNVFIASDKLVVLSDMYPIKQANRWILETMQPEQLLFLAPEFFVDQELPSLLSDSWAVGVLLSFMLNADIPWNTRNIMSMIHKILEAELPSHLPSEVIPLVSQLVRRVPTSRAKCSDILGDGSMLQIGARKRRLTDPPSNSPPKGNPGILPLINKGFNRSVRQNSPPAPNVSSLVIRRRFYSKLPTSAPRAPIPVLPNRDPVK